MFGHANPTVVIVCAAPNTISIRRKPWMAPGAAPVLAGMIPDGWNVMGWDETTQGPAPQAWLDQASLVMLTGLTPAHERMVEISTYCKDNEIPLIAGGRNVIGFSREPKGIDFLSGLFPSFCTTNVTTLLMEKILDDCLKGRLQQHYAVQEGEYEFVLPDRSIIKPSQYWAPYCVRSSAGCTRNCPWCTVGGQGQYYKPAEMLEAELKTFHYWFFLDVADSFAGDPSFVSEVILPIYRRSGMRWGTEAAVADLLGQDGCGQLIDEMKDAGCFILYIGIESITRRIGKASRERAEEVIRRCRKAGIVVIGSLILDNFGNETVPEIRETFEWAKRWLDFAQFSLTAALPGCALRRKAEAEGRIIEQDWRKFDGAHPTLSHELSPERREELLIEAYQEFAAFPWVALRALRARGLTTKLGILASGLRYRQGIPH